MPEIRRREGSIISFLWVWESALLEELANTDSELDVKLVDNGATQSAPNALTETEFRWDMNEDAMATEKLAEGIRNFTKDQIKLEQLLAEKL